jgi:hypothetical protein
MIEFEFAKFPSINRLFRPVVLSEKIDGMNAGIQITEEGVIQAQSRTQFIFPGNDVCGFARWVQDNRESLIEDLGPGCHFGEWWGGGIRRGYGLPNGEKRLSLFNTSRWSDHEFSTPKLGVVPVLWNGIFSEKALMDRMSFLRENGSVASPGFMKPEGIVMFHIASNMPFKITFDGDKSKFELEGK